MPLKLITQLFPIALAVALATSLLGAVRANAQTPVAAMAMVRIACDGPDINAVVTINGDFKGECPVDVPVAGGTLRVRVVKPVGANRESVFEQEVRIAPGTVKRLDVVMGAPQLTVQGRRLEEERLASERIETQRLAEERRRMAEDKARADAAAADSADAQAIERLDRVAAALLAEDRARRGKSVPGCVDCPMAIPGSSPGSIKMAVPAVSAPDHQRWLAQAVGEAQRYLATSGADFAPPAAPVPLPCEKAGAAMRRQAGLMLPAEFTSDELRENRARRQPRGFSFLRDVQLWPVQATCKDGQLDGPLDYWAFASSVNESDDYVIVSPLLMHLQMTMVAGKPQGEIFSATRNRDALLQYKVAATAEMMKNAAREANDSVRFTYRYAQGSDNLHSLTLAISLFSNPDVQKVANGPTVTVGTPLSGARIEAVSFSGQRKATRSILKDGKPHGEMTIYGYSQPVGFMVPDIKYPTTVACFKEGKEIKLNPCIVD